MKFIIGLLLAISGLILYLIGVLTPIDFALDPKNQARGTLFFFGLMLVLGGLFLMFVHAVSNRDKK